MKPGDFLLGVFDFFAILLPGVMATWLVAQYIPPAALRDALMFGLEGQQTPHEWVLATALLLSSYTLGHFVFMIGSRLDESYDVWRRRAKSRSRDTTYLAAKELHRKLNEELSDVTTLKWARTYIQVRASQARIEIDRLEADQKFFRSLVVVFALFAAHFFLREASPVAGVACIAAAVFSYRRYADQRWKMTELIYGTAVIVHKLNPPAAAAATAPVE
jgi:hypothetical protein